MYTRVDLSQKILISLKFNETAVDHQCDRCISLKKIIHSVRLSLSWNCPVLMHIGVDDMTQQQQKKERKMKKKWKNNIKAIFAWHIRDDQIKFFMIIFALVI